MQLMIGVGWHMHLDVLVGRLTRGPIEPFRDRWQGLKRDCKQRVPAAEVDAAAVQELVQKCRAHARLEEERFLPLAAQILGRRDGKMASLGLALHMRRVLRAASRGLRGS